MALHPLAGKRPPSSMLVNVPRLISAFYVEHPDVNDPVQRVSFGTSGHRGVSFKKSFNQDHIYAIAQAVCEYRAAEAITGPLFLGMDPHALSEPAFAATLEVLAANDVQVCYQSGFGYTPTPVISHAILNFNRTRTSGLADGIVITPSHNPPDNGGFKYNPPHGGPAGTVVTKQIEERANALLTEGNRGVKRITYAAALAADCTREYDYIAPYVDDLKNVIHMDAIGASGIRIGVDPMGGAGIHFWDPIAERYGLNIELVNREIDPTYRFMHVDKDGKIRMDCSSPWAMAGLLKLKDSFDISFGNDPDYDRHGIVTRSGLMNPNHYLAVAIEYLFQNRSGWSADAVIGKTLVSSSMIDKVGQSLGRKVSEVPVGFKWFVPGLLDGSCGFGGEESAGASFLRHDGTVWSTDKDGIIMDLLAAEITVKTGTDPAELYLRLVEKFGNPLYERLEAPANPGQKKILKNLSAEQVKADTLAGDPIVEKLTHASGNGASIGGLKVVTQRGWFAARPSGTEDIYKIYTESFGGAEHLKQLQDEAKAIVTKVLDDGDAK